jgi:outer membrane receptor protein involved in Fe transport
VKLPKEQILTGFSAVRNSALVFVLALCCGIQTAFADETVQFNIEPQSLETALQRFMEQSRVDLLYPAEMVRGHRTEGVSGMRGPEEALRMLLTGSGLEIERREEAFLLVDSEAALQRGNIASTITVTATRTERDLMEVPASVSVVTAEEIERQHTTKTEDALRSVPGLDLIYMPGDASASIPVLRGLGQSFAGTTTQAYLNGMPVEPLAITRRYLWYTVDPSTIERIEVVRGPSSVLYGPSAMGGVINLITKRGSGEPFADVVMGLGSHDGRSAKISAGGSVGDFDTYFSASLKETDGFKELSGPPAPWAAWYSSDYADLEGRDSESKKLNGRLTWWISEDTDLSLGAYRFENEGATLGGHPNFRVDQEGTVYDAALTHRFFGGHMVKGKLAYSDVSAPKRTYDDIAWGGTGLELVGWDDEYEESLAVDLQLDLKLLPNNTLTVGGTWWDGKFTGAEYDTSDVEVWSGEHKSLTYGIFVQDEHRFDRLTVTLGGRYDVYEHYDYESNGVGLPDADDEVFTPRIALNYRLDKGLSLYGSAGTAYIPAPNNLKYRTSPMWLNNPGLKPETSTSYEVGAKFRSPADMLKGSVAFYQTFYEDKIAVAMVGAQRQFQNLGKTRVNGFELELRSQLGEYWEPFFNYTYTESEIIKNPSDTSLEGNETANTPQDKANIGLLYDNPNWITAQAIGRYVGKRYYQDDNEDESRVDSHFLVDLKLSKTFQTADGPEWTASLSVDNLFDEKGYGFWYQQLDGRNFWLELGARF